MVLLSLFDNSSRVLNLYKVDSILGTGSLSIPILDHKKPRNLLDLLLQNEVLLVLLMRPHA